MPLVGMHEPHYGGILDQEPTKAEKIEVRRKLILLGENVLLTVDGKPSVPPPARRIPDGTVGWGGDSVGSIVGM